MNFAIFQLKRWFGVSRNVSILAGGLLLGVIGMAERSAIAQIPDEMLQEEYEDMMGEEGDFGGGYGPGNGGAAKALATPPLLLKPDPERISTALISSLDSILGPLPPGAVSSIPPLQRDSVVAYQNGDYPLGLGLYFANAIVDPDSAQETFTVAQYNSNLRRPIWSVRFGVAIAVRGDDTVSRSPIKAGSRSASGMGGFGGSPDRGPSDEDMMNRR